MAQKKQVPVLLHCSYNRFIAECESFTELLNECRTAASITKHAEALDYFTANRWALKNITTKIKLRQRVTTDERQFVNNLMQQMLDMSQHFFAHVEAKHNIIIIV